MLLRECDGGKRKMRKKLNWVQNVENIFTEKELKEFVNEGKLDKVKRLGTKYYIKRGCSRWFQKDK
jgi:hypothetical protein